MQFLSGLGALIRWALPKPPMSSYVGNTESCNKVLLPAFCFALTMRKLKPNTQSPLENAKDSYMTVVC